MRFAAIVFLILGCTLALVAQPRTPAIPAQNPAAPAAQVAPSAPQEDADALRDDLKRMRSLVQQMETNLAFVDPAQTPLKHQFQLEIDMWKTLIAQMERRLNAAKAR